MKKFSIALAVLAVAQPAKAQLVFVDIGCILLEDAEIYADIRKKDHKASINFLRDKGKDCKLIITSKEAEITKRATINNNEYACVRKTGEYKCLWMLKSSAEPKMPEGNK